MSKVLVHTHYYPTCPYCKTKQRVYQPSVENEEDYFCEGCGAKCIKGNWEKRCGRCRKKVKELHGLFVPHVCKPCLNKIVEEDKKTGNVCLMCRKVRSLCCC